MTPTLLILVLTTGCAHESDKDTSGSDTSGGDTSDSDTSDSTESGETGTAVWASFTGTATYTSSRDGVTRCDLAVALTGVANPTYCRDCDFAFDVSSTRTADTSTAECRASPTLTWLEEYGYSGLVLAFADPFTVDWVSPPVTIHDALLTGFDFNGGDYYVEDQWAVLGYADDGQSALAWTGPTLHWRLAAAWSYTYTYTYGLDGCGDAVSSPATAPATGAPQAATLTADGSTQDVWTFAGDAGVGVVLSVDTVQASTTFAPYLILTGPDGCTVMAAVDNFACTAAPGPRACPAIQLDLPESGTYELRVGSDGWQAGALGEYTLTVSGVEAPTQVEDETAAHYEHEVPWTTDVVLDATLVPAP